MSELPIWARKPKHKKELIATARGWEVKETGELLRSTKFLDTRLGNLVKEVSVIEDFIFPHDDEGKGSEVTSLPGGHTEPEQPATDEGTSVEPTAVVEEDKGEKEEPVKESPKQRKKPGPKPKTKSE